MRRLRSGLACLVLGCGTPPEALLPGPTSLLSAWVARIPGDALSASPVQCLPGGELAAVREGVGPPPERGCWVSLSAPGRPEAVRISELEFANPQAAQEALAPLLARGEGADAMEPCGGGCKALVSGWVEGFQLFQVSTRAVGWEADGCVAIDAFGVSNPEGMHHCAPVPFPSAAPEVGEALWSAAEWRLSSLLPSPHLSLAPSTFELRDLDLPADGIRARADGVEVSSAAWAGGVVDGLREEGRVFLEAGLPGAGIEDHLDPDCPDCAGSLRISRLVRIVRVDAETISAWVGTSSFTSGAAHSMNQLGCATFARRTGARLHLSDLVGAGEAAQLLAAPLALDLDGDLALTLDLGWMREVSWPTGDTEELLLDGAGGPLLCLPVEVGPGGSTWVVRPGALPAQ